MFKIAALLFGMCVVVNGQAAYASETYHNEKYGFSVEIPLGITQCLERAPSPNHGVTLLLGRPTSCSNETKSASQISVFGEFNAYETQSLDQLKSYVCGQTGEPVPDPNSFRIPGVKTEACIVRGKQDAIEVWVLAQNSSNADIDEWVNYEIVLKSPNSKFDCDLIVLRKVLLGIRLSRPE